MPIHRTETLYVRLVDEAVDMWRPVEGFAIDKRLYRIAAEQHVPDDERWEFGPGEIVAVVTRDFEGTMRKIVVSARARRSM